MAQPNLGLRDATIPRMAIPAIGTPTLVPLTDLKPHPRNYRRHPPDQIAHLAESIREHGLYRNIVTADDLTILAGHGVELAAREAGLTEIPVVRLPISADSPQAWKILAGDNEISLLAETDDRALVELLKQIRDSDDVAGLLGTGYDDMTLASLLLVTRPAAEIADHDAAAQWVGMPEYEPGPDEVVLILRFDDEGDRDRLVEQLELTAIRKHLKKWSTNWPPRPQDDLVSLRFTTAGADA